MEKDFENWHNLKVAIHIRKAPQFNDREIWWCSIGLNIGFEEDGKNNNFERPVLVYRKLNQGSFIGMPLTSVLKDEKSPHYYNYSVNGVEGSVIISQLRLYSAQRLNRKLSKMNKADFITLQTKVIKIMLL